MNLFKKKDDFIGDSLRDLTKEMNGDTVEKLVEKVVSRKLNQRKETDEIDRNPEHINAYKTLPSIQDQLKAIQDHLGIEIEVVNETEKIIIKKTKK